MKICSVRRINDTKQYFPFIALLKVVYSCLQYLSRTSRDLVYGTLTKKKELASGAVTSHPQLRLTQRIFCNFILVLSVAVWGHSGTSPHWLHFTHWVKVKVDAAAHYESSVNDSEELGASSRWWAQGLLMVVKMGLGSNNRVHKPKQPSHKHFNTLILHDFTWLTIFIVNDQYNSLFTLPTAGRKTYLLVSKLERVCLTQRWCHTQWLAVLIGCGFSGKSWINYSWSLHPLAKGEPRNYKLHEEPRQVASPFTQCIAYGTI
jgi:hypothetical protein